MTYLVSLEDSGMRSGFTHTFSGDDRQAILAAEPGKLFGVRNGTGILKDDHVQFALQSPGGIKHHFINFEDLCWQLDNPEKVTLYT